MNFVSYNIKSSFYNKFNSNEINLNRILFVILFDEGVMVMVFNATFNNISAISWRSILLVEETEVPGENHQPVASH